MYFFFIYEEKIEVQLMSFSYRQTDIHLPPLDKRYSPIISTNIYIQNELRSIGIFW